MYKLCERALNFFQICDEEGSVRLCGWIKDEYKYLGKLTEHSVYELYNSSAAKRIRAMHCMDDYSLCDIDACSYLATNDIENHKVCIESTPDVPDSLYLGYERVCNYSCKSCTVHTVMERNKGKDLNEQYDIIEKRIREVLPKIKHISANGCGEIFACPRTLKLLSEWKPEAPVEECSVSIETNGSLFDEKHWEQIKGLGKYHLNVAISVMSFDEKIYQYLSGTSLPISKLVDNLCFIKKLRENGLINYLELATVVQEQNFREMPDFARRCIEDFGADYVRLRPYRWWGECSKEEAWFKDVRNPNHPLYDEYKKTMQDSCLNHPKVHDWSGGLDAEWISLMPSEIEKLKTQVVTDLSLHQKEIVSKYFELNSHKKGAIIYGLSNAGKILTNVLYTNGITCCIMDRYMNAGSWNGVSVLNPDTCDELDRETPVIVTPIEKTGDIICELKKCGWKQVVDIRDFLCDENLKEHLAIVQ